MQQLWRIELFGGLRVRSSNDNGREINRFRTQRAAALLAYLAYYLHRNHSRELLIEILWPESETAAKQNSFRVALASLRSQLEPPGVIPGSVLFADRNSIRLNPAAVTTDVADFEALIKAAAASHHELEKIKLLTDALALYQGTLLASSFDEWVLVEQTRLDSLAVQALRDLVESLKQVGDIPRAIEHIQRALTFDPECEEAIDTLMELYLLDGQPATALRHYGDFERNLLKKYGARPSAATQERARQISQQVSSRTLNDKTESTSAAGLSIPSIKRQPRTAKLLSKTVGNDAEATGSDAPNASARVAPSGTVTFLIFDIRVAGVEGSEATGVSAKRDTAKQAKECREAVAREVESHQGYAARATNDSFLFAFARAGEALGCAIACVARCVAPEGNSDGSPTVTKGGTSLRAALFTRDAEFRDGAYHDCSYDDLERILLAANDWQIVCAADTASLLRTQNQAAFHLTNLGYYRLPCLDEPVNLFQVNSAKIPFREYPPLDLPAVHSGNLPIQYNSFFGRENEITQLSDVLISRHCRIITLTGMGGSGKTRLALELARRLLKPWRGEVWFVSLSDISDPQLIVNAIRDSLRLPSLPHTSPLEQVVDLLSRQPSLLLLDNFEHILEEGAPCVELLLNRIPTLTVLTTSQRRLNIANEEEYRVDTLPIPQGMQEPAELVSNPSVQLFVDRAQSVRSDFQVKDSNAREVARLCKHLDGIPLAIELAAVPRAATLTPAQMMVRLAEHGLDSFVNPKRNAVQRQRTLRAALEWSHQLLPPPVQQFFNQMAVFRGGWTLEAAEQVPVVTSSSANESNGKRSPEQAFTSIHALEYLEILTGASLVIMEGDAPNIRFRMLETIHGYAHSQLERHEDSDTLRRSHALYYLRMAEEAELQLQGPAQSEWFSLLYKEQENLRAALDWALDTSDPMHLASTPGANFHNLHGSTLNGRAAGKPVAPSGGRPRDIEVALRLVNALGLFWELHGHATEGRLVMRRLLDHSLDALPELRATALFHAGRLAVYQNDFATARSMLEQALELRREIGEKRGIALVLVWLGIALTNQGDLAAAGAMENQALGILREFGDKRNMVTALNALSGIALSTNEIDDACRMLEEGMILCKELGDRRGVALSLSSLGCAAMSQNDFNQARELMQQSLDIMRELDDKWGVAIALNSLGFVTMNLGDLDTARALLEEGLPIFRELGVKARAAEALSELGDLARCQSDYEEAFVLYSKSLSMYEEIEFRSGIAWALHNLGWVAFHRRDIDTATRLFARSIALYQGLEGTLGIIHCLAGFAAIEAVSGKSEDAARLLGATEALRAPISVPMFLCEQMDREFTMEAIREFLDEQQLAKIWAQGRTLSLEEAVALIRHQL